MKLELYRPKLEDLWFRQKMLEDEETMSFNAHWGGAINFPKEDWEEWYNHWVNNHSNKRYYRYVKDGDNFIGEIAYHFDKTYNGYVANVLIYAKYRKQGYGREALRMLCEVVKNGGAHILYDDIAIDNPAISLFLKEGFKEECRTDEIILLKKEL